MKVGASVDLPREKIIGMGLPPKVEFESVGKINGFCTAKFVSDKTYNTKDLCKRYRDCIAWLREAGVEGSDFFEKSIEETKQYQRERREVFRNCVDLTTGLTVSLETFVRDSTNVSPPTAVATMFQISS